MKQKLFTLLLSCILICTAKAQYVNIPDTNFSKFLIAQYPSCLYKDSAANKYYMDTTCGAVVNETTIHCKNQNIKDLEGIQYFKELEFLGCDSNQLLSLSTLPNNLIILFCSFNQLASIPNLPNNIRLFYCNVNNLTSLPVLPDSLRELSCYANNLTNLPLLPDSLKDLECDQNQLSTLPALPTNLEILNCSFNILNNLPLLPNKLKLLNCIINKLTSLPALPDSLYILDCYYNNISCLPKLPTNLNFLGADFGTKINCTPNYFIGYNSSIHSTICNPTNNPNQCQIYPSISGNVFTDNNSNSIKDTLELYRPFVKLSFNNGQTTYSNLQGSYGISIDSLGSYTLKVTPPPYYKAVPDSVTINFTANTTVTLPDIALQPIASVDSFAIHITKLNRPRPGFNYAYNVSYGNVGTVSSTSNNIVNVVYDTSKIHFDSASVAIQSNTNLGGNYAQVVVNAGSLVAGQGGTFNVYYTVKSTVPIGDSIKTSADISHASTKTYHIDSAIVTGSFDPNDKQATPELSTQQVADGKRIDYTIRFQNTGNDTAIHIVIADTLSSKLQANSLQIVATSHNCKTSIKDGIVFFEMRDIMLPDSNVNKIKSNGFIRFTMLPKSSVVAGDNIPNSAAIYFDYNKPVITNTAITKIKNNLLPVKITNYVVSIVNEKQIINKWTTANEINLSHFVIQRSIDGKVFKSVGSIAVVGASHYSFIDPIPNTQYPITLYYRLQSVDKDGKYSFSEVRQITINQLTNKPINIFPNPANKFISLKVDKLMGAATVVIVDMYGKQVLKQIINNQLSIINIQPFAQGTYFVEVTTNNGRREVETFIKE